MFMIGSHENLECLSVFSNKRGAACALMERSHGIKSRRSGRGEMERISPAAPAHLRRQRKPIVETPCRNDSEQSSGNRQLHHDGFGQTLVTSSSTENCRHRGKIFQDHTDAFRLQASSKVVIDAATAGGTAGWFFDHTPSKANKT